MMVMSLGVLCKIYLLTEIYHLALQYPAALWKILASFTIFFFKYSSFTHQLQADRCV